MVSWGTIKSLTFTLAPLFLPKAISYYRSARSAPAIAGKPVQATPAPVRTALAILFIVASITLLSTLPIFAPENIFAITKSRLQIPVDVLFTRLNTIRPQGLTREDDILRGKLASAQAKLLYFKYGPEALTDCLFCNVEDPISYFYYSIPSIIIPHLFNICVIALVTSGSFVGKEAASWRIPAVISAVSMIGIDMYLVNAYDHGNNARTARLEDIDAFFWTMRIYRKLAICVLDSILGWVIWLTATNRAFVTPHTTAERIERTTRVLESTRSKLGAMGVVRNTVARDENLRNRTQAYWIHEGRLVSEAMEDREVVEGVNNALENRINVAKIAQDADTYAGGILGFPSDGSKKDN